MKRRTLVRPVKEGSSHEQMVFAKKHSWGCMIQSRWVLSREKKRSVHMALQRRGNDGFPLFLAELNGGKQGNFIEM
jgi:hypothetical protein